MDDHPPGPTRAAWPLVALLGLGAVVVAAIAVLLVRAGDDGAALPSTTVAPASTGGRMPLDGFGQVLVEVTAADGSTCQACLLLADTPAQRSRGLMEVTDPTLGGYDGMLFAYDRPAGGGFWMRNTRIPLTGIFFDADGRFLDAFDMVPCPDSTADAECPRYGPDESFTTVIELAALDPSDLLLAEGSTVEVVGDVCPEVLAGRG